MKVVARHGGQSKIGEQVSCSRRRCRWPLFGSCPRGVLGVAALADRKQPVTESDSESAVTARSKPDRRRSSPGGAPSALRSAAHRGTPDSSPAERSALSAQRFVVETALPGSATAAARRRRSQPDAERAPLILASISNNVNRLAKWANTNHVIPEVKVVDATLLRWLLGNYEDRGRPRARRSTPALLRDITNDSIGRPKVAAAVSRSW
jgi:hypothetical protein